MSGPKEILRLMFAATLLAACSAPAESERFSGTREVVKGREQLNAHVAECTARYGYDPESASASVLGPHALGTGEREWRECVYQGMEKFLIPKTLSPEAYRNAIAEDRKMTDAVAGGKMTRAERREKVQEIIQEIDRIEEANRAKIQSQAMDRAMKDEVQRQLDATRRSMLAPLGR